MVNEHIVDRAEYRAAVKQRGRPKAEVTKVPVKLRLDPDVLAVLRASGDGWQTRVNRIFCGNGSRCSGPYLGVPVTLWFVRATGVACL